MSPLLTQADIAPSQYANLAAGSKPRDVAVRRRDFIALFAGGAVALPRVVHAQPIPVIVFFNSGTPSTYVKNVAAFHNGLKETGLVEGQNFAIEFVWAENRFDGLE